MTVTLKLTYKGFNYVDYYNGEYANNTLSTLATTGANSVALTPDYGIEIANSIVYAGGATTDTQANLTTTIKNATSDTLTSFVRPLVDFLYPQLSPTHPGNYYVPNQDNDMNPAGYYPKDLPTGVTPASPTPADYDAGNTVNYRGELDPADINLATFFGKITTAGSYDYVIYNEAKAAAAAGATLFSVGTELDSLADDPAATSDWTGLIASIRSAFPTLKLTYSANWANASQVTFWNKLDYVGIDGYVPLSNTIPDAAGDNNPSEASLVAGWNKASDVVVAYSGGTTVSTALGGVSAIDAFDSLAQQSISKQFLFTEIGYQNDTGAASDPTGGSATGVQDPTLQAALYQAFFTAWGQAQQTAASNGGMVDGIPYSLAGAYFWAWDPDSSTWVTTAKNYDSWQPATQTLAVIGANFGAAQPPVVVAETNSAGVAGYMGSPTAARGTAGIGGSGALAGDSDPGGLALTVSAIAGGVVGSPFSTTYGTITLNADGSYTYFEGNASQAPTGAPASDVITFTVSDTAGASTTSTLTISDYRTPTAVAQTASVRAGTTLARTAATGALSGDSDPDGVALQVGGVYPGVASISETAPGSSVAGSYGTLTVNADGSYTYVAKSAAALASSFAASKGAPLVDTFSLVVAGGAGTYAISSLSVSVSAPTMAKPDDLNGDGKSDVVLQNSGGTTVVFTMNGGLITAGTSLGNFGAGTQLVGTGDFNGDGTADTLVEGPGGSLVVFTVQNTSYTAGYSLGSYGSAWSVAGTGDFNGDGKSDILLQNSNGAVVGFTMNGGSITAGTSYGSFGTSKVVGIGDFNGDGTSDMLVQSTTGTLTEFTVVNNSLVAGYNLGTYAGFRVAGVGDYNGDGKADILLQNTSTNAVVIFSMNGGSIVGGTSLGTLGGTKVIETGDYNGDGTSDIVTQASNGALTLFLVNNDQLTAGYTLGNPGSTWHGIDPALPGAIVGGTSIIPASSYTTASDELAAAALSGAVTAPPDPAAAPPAATVPQAPVPAAATITLADPGTMVIPPAQQNG
jgi:VCBS repeat-containing protein